MEEAGANLSPEEILNKNYQTRDNVLARFGVYELMRSYINLESLAIDVLELPKYTTVVDVGTGDGSLLHRLGAIHGHRGRKVGIEPNDSQFKSAAIWQSIEAPTLNLGESFFQKYKASGIFAKSVGIEPPFDVELYTGDAIDNPLEDDIADVLFAMFMLYHIPTDKQPAAIEKFKQIMKPDGIMVATTSSSYNKRYHREIEGKIAEFLGVERPAIMNTQYTTEIARLDLPLFFEHVYAYDFSSPIDIFSDEEAEIYLNSIRSMRDQYPGEPGVQEYEAAIQSVVRPLIAERMQQRHGKAIDIASRSIFICSDRPLDIPLRDNRFKEIGYVETIDET